MLATISSFLSSCLSPFFGTMVLCAKLGVLVPPKQSDMSIVDDYSAVQYSQLSPAASGSYCVSWAYQLPPELVLYMPCIRVPFGHALNELMSHQRSVRDRVFSRWIEVVDDRLRFLLVSEG